MARTRRKLLIVLAALGVGFGAAELCLRTFRPVKWRAPIERQATDAWSSLIHRASRVPGLSYELNPSSSAVLPTMTVSINSEGLRGPEIARTKPEGTRRIAIVGDSVTFGFHVEESACYARILERLLAASPVTVGERWQVLNFGVGGYSSSNEAALVRARVLDYAPDLVIVGYCLNDPENEPTQPLQRAFRDPPLWERSHVLRLFGSWIQRARRDAHAEKDSYKYWHALDGPIWESVPRALEDMRAVLGPRGVPLELVVFPVFQGDLAWTSYGYGLVHEQLARTAHGLGIDTLDLRAAYAATNELPRALSVDPEHPNARGHEIAARALADWLLADAGLRLRAR